MSAFDGQRALHYLGEAPGNSKPQARAAGVRIAAGIDLHEGLEDFLQLVRGNADAGILDVNQQCARAATILFLPGEAMTETRGQSRKYSRPSLLSLSVQP